MDGIRDPYVPPLRVHTHWKTDGKVGVRLSDGGRDVKSGGPTERLLRVYAVHVRIESRNPKRHGPRTLCQGGLESCRLRE